MPKKVSEVDGCLGCPMRRLFPNNTFVAPKMGSSSRLVIAEAPGKDEAEAGEPLVGGAGRWFDSLASKAGLRRDQLTLTNCIQCRPPDNVFPTDAAARKYISRDEASQAVSQCLQSHVYPLLHSRDWTRVDLLGDKPLHLLARKSGITTWSGSPLAIPELGNKTIAVPTFHPAYIARDQTMIPKVINDLSKGNTPPPEFYNIFPSLTDVENFTATEFAFDIESDMKTGKITMVGLCAKPYYSIIVPYSGAYISELKRIFSKATSLIAHNGIQFDIPRLRDHGVTCKPDVVVWDTMLIQHLCFPDFPHDLEFVSSQFTQKPAWKDDARGTGHYWQLRCARDADVTLQSHRQLLPMLREFGMERLYLDVQWPLALVCKGMKDRGITLDPKRIKFVREKFLAQMQEAEKALPPEMQTHSVPVNKREPAPAGTLSPKTGKPVKYIMVPSTEDVTPWRSPKQKQEFLYGSSEPWHLGLPIQYDVKSGRITTGKIALDRLYSKTKNPALKAIRVLNQLDELVTTFAKEEMLDQTRQHTNFNVHGTNSGRLSSSNPNLQNIPESTRYIYVPSEPDWQLVQFDYSGIENRLTAYFAGDTARLARFQSIPGFSEHKYLCSKIFGIAYEDVVKDNSPDAPYNKAKHVVHGSNYGAGAKKISNMYDMDYKETKELLAMWKKEIWDTCIWQERTGEQAKRDGYLRTPFGRMRWFYTASSYTESLSFLPQSSAADCIYRSMIGLMYERIGWSLEKALSVCARVKPIPQNAHLLLQVHDALLFECPSVDVPELIATVRYVMEQPWRELGGFSIPVSVEVSPPGASWGECE